MAKAHLRSTMDKGLPTFYSLTSAAETQSLVCMLVTPEPIFAGEYN